jgi:hypothetical protein
VKRRRRFLVAAALTVALCAGYLWATLDHRLDHGSSWWHGAADIRTEGTRTELRFAVNPGGQVTFGVAIRNPGPWPVTVTGIGPPDRQIFKVARLAANHVTAPAAVEFVPAAALPFRPTRIGAGKELPVFLTITIPDVPMSSGSGLYFDGLAIDFTVLGLPRHQRVPMGFRLLVSSPDDDAPH